jgi:phage tail-like protein
MTALPTAAPGAGARNRTAAEVDPLGELIFKITVEDRAIGRFAECTGLAVEYDVTDYAEGGNNEFVHKLRGRVRYPNVTLKRGVTYEDELLRWFFTDAAPDARPTLTITIMDQAGAPVRIFALTAAQPVRWTGPSATAQSNNAATESLEIAHAGFA